MNQTVNIDVQVQSKSLNQLEEELSQINDELSQVAIGSQAFKDLSKQAQAATKQLDKANEAAEGFTDDKKFMAADGAIKAMAGSLTGVVGALGLIGVESETFGEMEKKAASAIAVAMGVKDVSEGYKQLKDSTALATVQSKIFGMTTKQALIATGIGIFVVVLGTMIAYWDDIVKGVRKFGEEVPIVGKVVQGLEDAFNGLVDAFRPVLEFLGILPDEAERANQAVIDTNNALIDSNASEIAMMQARGEAAEDIHAKKLDMMNAEIDNLKRTDAEAADIKAAELERDVFVETEKTRVRKEEAAKRLQIQKDSDAAFLQQQLEAAIVKQDQQDEINAALKAMLTEKKEEDLIDFAAFDEAERDLEDMDLEEGLKRNQRVVEANKLKEAQLKDAREAGLANIIAIAGAEGNIGKAAFIAQQILSAKKMIMEAKETIT